MLLRWRQRNLRSLRRKRPNVCCSLLGAGTRGCFSRSAPSLETRERVQTLHDMDDRRAGAETGEVHSMSATSTAKRRRRQARLLNGRKVSRLDFKRKLLSQKRGER